MSEYRRSYVPGGTYFFTLTTLGRRPILIQEPYRNALRQAINEVRKTMPFQIIAWVLLPDHLHAVWKLPESDVNFSLRWSLIKQHVTRECAGRARNVPTNKARQRRNEGTIWQRRFWEHTIRDEADFRHHIDYIHYNPVKHGYVTNPADWPYSTFHRYASEGVYTIDWASADEIENSSYGE
jgi:putative transposase